MNTPEQPIHVIAGHCSESPDNHAETLEIGSMQVNGGPAIHLVRLVGVKSRTEPTSSVDGGGMDADIDRENRMAFAHPNVSVADLQVPPSYHLIDSVMRNTPAGVATEIIDPITQLTTLANFARQQGWGDRLMVWNPAINQSGHQAESMAQFASVMGSRVGIKNGKWDDKGKTWSGLINYAKGQEESPILKASDLFAIHRGFDIQHPERGKKRNMPLHEVAKEIKRKHPDVKMLFDPSHIFGPKCVEEIVPATIEAMSMKMEDGSYLYDGVLIEVGTSSTDTEQHISIDDLRYKLLERLSDIRGLAGPREA